MRTGPLPGNADVLEIADGATVVCTFADVSGDATPEPGAPLRHRRRATRLREDVRRVLGAGPPPAG